MKSPHWFAVYDLMKARPPGVMWVPECVFVCRNDRNKGEINRAKGGGRWKRACPSVCGVYWCLTSTSANSHFMRETPCRDKTG